MDNEPVGQMNVFLKSLRSRGLKCRTILDVGANRGKWSTLARKYFPQATFCLIEPLEEMVPYLEKFIRKSPKSKYIVAGAGPKNDKLLLTYWNDPAGATLLSVEDKELKKAGKQRKVDIVPIDDVLSSFDLPVPELIKLDVQGFELEALKGANSTFGTTEVYILEVSLYSFERHEAQPLLCDVINFMDQREYVVYDFAGFLRRPYDGALGQCDIAFVKREGMFRHSNKWVRN